jgi:hypothetical protein
MINGKLELIEAGMDDSQKNLKHMGLQEYVCGFLLKKSFFLYQDFF